MIFQMSLNGKEFFQTELYLLLIAGLFLVAIFLTIVIYLWHRLSEGEVMKYEFLTIIAHKFRTPLTHLKWSVEGLLESNIDETSKESARDIGRSTEKLIGLTSTMIELTDNKNQSQALYNFERVDFCQLVKNVAAPFKNVFHEKNIFFSVYCDEGPIVVKLDIPRMEFVIGTLLENACNYTPVGKTVSVKVGAIRGKAILEVTDAGIGIAPSEMPRIFQKFYRAEAARRADTEGVGVGLFLAQSILKRHKGYIEVHSNGLDTGATFRLVIPRAK